MDELKRKLNWLASVKSKQRGKGRKRRKKQKGGRRQRGGRRRKSIKRHTGYGILPIDR